jgi:putative acetyltransferase
VTAADVEYRRAVAADAESVARLMSDEAVFAGLLQLPYPTPDLWRKRLETQVTDQDALHLVGVAGGHVIGSGGLGRDAKSLRRRHVAGLGLSVAAEWQGRGIGSELMRRLLDWADNWVGVLRIELGVYTDNERAIALYRKFGFQLEDTQRAYALRKGVYVESHMMARLHPNPPALPGR